MTEAADQLGILLGSRDLADRLLERTTLRHLVACPLDELARLIPRRSAERLYAAFRLGREAVSPRRPRRLETPEDVYRHLHPYLTGLETERMVVVACDIRGQPLATEVVAEGGPNEVSVRISDLFTPALRHRAVAIVIAHNHPSNDPGPSPQDLRLTERVRQAADLLEIQLIDHLIIAGTDFVSLRLQGVPGLLEDAPVCVAAAP